MEKTGHLFLLDRTAARSIEGPLAAPPPGGPAHSHA